MKNTCKHHKKQQTSGRKSIQKEYLNQKAKQQYTIGSFEMTPHYMRDNPHILTGYRINFNTFSKNLKSLFMTHNQTVNIWTHCLSATLFICLIVSFYLALVQDSFLTNFFSLAKQVNRKHHEHHSFLQNMIKYKQESLFQLTDFHSFNLNISTQNIQKPTIRQQVSRWPILVFLISAMLCLLFSTIFHLFHPISKAYGVLLRLDFAGISLAMAGSGVSCFYYNLYCHTTIATIYITYTVVFALVCFFISLFEFFHEIGNQIYRIVTFGLFGLSGFVPLSHIVINEVVYDNFGDAYSIQSSLIYYMILLFCYLFGLYVYTVRCPQRKNPGKYDICGQSHQIWHCAVTLGMFFTYLAVFQNYEMRKKSSCPV